jgi:hypothetical protein
MNKQEIKINGITHCLSSTEMAKASQRGPDSSDPSELGFGVTPTGCILAPIISITQGLVNLWLSAFSTSLSHLFRKTVVIVLDS